MKVVFPANVTMSQNIVESAAPVQNLWDFFDIASNPGNFNNLYWDTAGGVFQNNAPFPDTSAKFGNPLFANPGAGSYALGAGSAASSIGFLAINQSTIGLQPATAHWYP